MSDISFYALVTIILIFTSLVIAYTRRDKVPDKWGLGVEYSTHYSGWIFKAILASIIVCVFVRFMSTHPTDIREEHYRYIKSLKNNIEIDGGFVLGSGSIENIEYYYFFYKSELGYKRGKLQVSKCSIVETSEKNPEIVRRVQCYEQNGFIKWSCTEIDFDTYIIYVPENTVIEKFKVH